MAKEQLTEKEVYEQQLKENPPKYIEELDRRPGEVDFSKLNDGDKFQVLTRYLNDLCSINKSNLQITADLYVIVEFICEKLGIDIKAKKQELAKKYKAQMEQNIKDSKEQLEKAGKKQA